MTYLGEKGVRISGGEKQRISLARALLKDAEIILLDEPTSNLDSKNEEFLHKLIKELKGKKTLIIITHRPSTIKDVDKVLKL